MKTPLLLLLSLLLAFPSSAQSKEEKKLMKTLKADRIDWLGDGVFKSRDKKTEKWGLYQWHYGTKLTEVNELIPMRYDSLHFFGFNELYMPVFYEGKVGIYLSELSYHEKAKESLPCIYDEYKVVNVHARDGYPRARPYMAVAKDGKWAWVDWLKGELKTEFIYDSFDDLPGIRYSQPVSFE